MSLAARIALAPSSRTALAERTVPMLGAIVAATTLIARWPSHTLELVVMAVVVVACCAIVGFRRDRRARPMTLHVADRTTFDVACDGSIDGAARLVESTVVWPGFAMLALAVDDGRTVVRRAVVAAELAPAECRALQRFLLWSLRARGGAPTGDGSRAP
jgi:di/tricarboxylate transporter